MSEREKVTSTDEEMRPLPDGGLSDAMPDWLRRPPAWRDLAGKDDPPVSGGKALPEPDTSVIDPRQLVTIDDLPQWLRDIAAREPIAAPETAPPTPEVAEESVVVTTVDHGSESAPTEPAGTIPTHGTAPWIWAMRAAIILIILAIIFYVFIL